MKKDFDIIVIGAGHAGVEAALASARLNKKVLIATISLDAVAYMPCNPSIGGTGKGQLVREIDALGGEMGINIDKTCIQTRMLNASKGTAVHSPRAQADKNEYHKEMLATLKKQKNLTLIEDEALQIVPRGTKNDAKTVIFKNNGEYQCKKCIIATGTYLNAHRLRSSEKEKGGPLGFNGSYKLSKAIKDIGIKVVKFKTGTPARVYENSINTKELKEQKGDEPPITFSYLTEIPRENKKSCYLTYTNEETHKIVKQNIKKSAIYGGHTEGTGPRYCLCIEDKVMKFPERNRHQTFLEPETEKEGLVYIQGLSSNLPIKEQKQFYRTIKGLENAQFDSFAYTIEYDCIAPEEITLSLESKKCQGLYFAGQIIGSSGYEEAAASGIMAGINAALSLSDKEPFILRRDEAYIGVLIDDIVTKLPDEPYRIMTSRAEHRLLLRQDNADDRLTKKGYEIGIVTKERYEKWKKSEKKTAKVIELFKATRLKKEQIETVALKTKKTSLTIKDILIMPEVSIEMIGPICEADKELKKKFRELSKNEKTKVEAIIKYEGYIKKEMQTLKKIQKTENKIIPKELDYAKLTTLKVEAIEKLNKVKPKTIGQASRIPGVSPADITALLMYLIRESK